MKTIKGTLRLGILAALFSGADRSEAVDAYWIAGHGDFNTPANWSTAAVPGDGDSAIFTNNFSGQVVTWSGGATNANISFTDLTGAGNGPGGLNIVTGPMYVVTNRFLVDGLAAGSPYIVNYNGNMFLTNAGGTAELLIGPTGKGTLAIVSGTATVDRLTLTNGANSVLITQGGTLNILHGSEVRKAGGNQFVSQFAGTFTMNLLGGTNLWDATGGTILGQSGGASAGIVTVSGAGTLWTNTGMIYIGNNGIGSLVTVADGARVASAGGILGNTSGSLSNRAVITGNNSLWNITGGQLLVGSAGSYNRLTVTNGGTLQNAAGTYISIGNAASGNSNVVLVTGANSLWNAGANTIIVGAQGKYNQLNIENGGAVTSAGLTLGQTTGSEYNSVTITGSSSILTASGAVSIGGLTGNSLTVADGGTFSSASPSAHIGGASASSGNVVTVTGPGSMWTNTGAIYIGNQGYANRLIITNGGRVYGTEGRVGSFSAFDNLAIVTGSDSLWQNSGDMIVGRQMSGNNHLIVSDGGTVRNANGYLGMFNANTDTNKVTVTGAGSVWTNSGTLIVGNEGSFNELTIADGGKVFSATTTLGSFTTASRNKATITDSGSVWTVTSTFSIGGNSGGGGWGNQVVVTNGGKLDSTTAGFIAIGNGAASSNNSVLVTGAGSLWDAGANIIRVGSSGAGNRLHVTQGGEVRANDVFLGSAFSSTNNVILLTEGGTLDTTSLSNVGGNTGTFTNRGGILQLRSATPSIGPDVAGNFVTTNGTISFRGISDAPVAPLSGMTYQGNNTFRLNQATNALVTSYTFDTAFGPTNYHKLVLTNNALWRSGSLTIGANGQIDGGADGRLELTGDLVVNQTDGTLFELETSTVSFIGGGVHTNLVTGEDLGHDGSVGFPDGFTRNFSYGKLTLGDTDQLYVGTGNGASSNALYVFELDLFGSSTNEVANLFTIGSGINIYYAHSSLNPNNAYLNDLVYNLSGGGLLLPSIPEPGAALMLAIAGALLVRRKRNG